MSKWQVGFVASIGRFATRTHQHTLAAVARLAVLHYCHVDFLRSALLGLCHSFCLSLSLFLFCLLSSCCLLMLLLSACWACAVCSVPGVYSHILVCMHVVSAAMSLCKLPALCRRQLPVTRLPIAAFIVSLCSCSSTSAGDLLQLLACRRARLFLVLTWLVVAAAAVAVTACLQAAADAAATSFACCFSGTFSPFF